MTAAKTCPMCSTDAEADAPTCLCGYRFSSHDAVDWTPADATPTVPGDGWTMAGWALVALGAIGVAMGFFSGISVDGGYGNDDIVNLGLMFEKGVVLACGLSAVTVGTLCLGIGAIVKAIGRNS